MEAYKRWIWRHREYVHSIESLANGLTWLLPERFSDSEIAPEAVSSILAVITTINGHIIDTAPTPGHFQCGPHTLPNPLWISILSDLETLVEVVAEHYYGDKKWNFIAVTEATKVLFRLASFRNTGYKMLLNGGYVPNDGKDTGRSDLQHRAVNLQKVNGHHGPYNFKNYNGLNLWSPEGRALSALSRFGDSARLASDPAWFRQTQHWHSITEPPTPAIERPRLSTILSEKGVCGALFVMGELLFITRPVIYVLFVRKYGTRSWVPWFLSLAVDVLGMGAITQVANSRWWSEKGRQIQFSAAENDELKRRKLLWALYLMRDPFFSKYTRQKLESTQRTLEPVPIIGFVTEKLVDLMVGAQSRYTYMSGS